MALSPQKRSTIRHLINVTTKWENPNGEEDFQLVNEGVTELTEDLNPDTDDLQFVAEDEKTHVIKTYGPAITLSAVMVDAKLDPVNGWIQKVINRLPKNDEADTAYIRFNVLDKIDAESDENAKTYVYYAYKRNAVVEATSIGGSAGDNVEMEVTVSGRGAAVKGKLTINKSTTPAKYTFEATEGSTNKSVEFTVTDNATPPVAIKDASVEFNGQTKLTDENGKVSFNIDADGTYLFIVAKNEYESVTSNKTITSTSEAKTPITVKLTSTTGTYSLRD